MIYKSWKNNNQYMSNIKDLLNTKMVQDLSKYTQHHHSTRLQHSIYVSYVSYLIAKKLHLNARAAARGGLLHDLFYYNWRTTKFDLGSHAFIHPRVALRNAKRITNLTSKEKDIILKHMWGLTLSCPKYPESFIVSFVDDYAAVYEFCSPMKKNLKQIIQKI